MTHSSLYFTTPQTGYHSNGHLQANQSIGHFRVLTSPDEPVLRGTCQTWWNIPPLAAAHSEAIRLWSVSRVNTAVEVKPKAEPMLKSFSRWADKTNKVLCQAKCVQSKQTLQQKEDFAFLRKPSHDSGVYWSQMHFVHPGKNVHLRPLSWPHSGIGWISAQRLVSMNDDAFFCL